MMAKIIHYEPGKTPPMVSGKKVLVGGCFDLLHIGHIQFLNNAKERAEVLVIALENDIFIQKRKKHEPFHTQKERAKILAALRCVDVVLLLPYFSTELEYDALVKSVRPTVIAVTENDPHIEKKRKQAKKTGAVVAIVSPYIEGKSSSERLRHATEKK